MLLESVSENSKLAKIMNIKKYENQNYIVEKILAKNQIDKKIIILSNEKNIMKAKISENLLNILRKLNRC